MSRRRRNHQMMTGAAYDPGKDLFAYLFLLMVVFVFVLLMTLHQVHGEADRTHSPLVSKPQGSSNLKSLENQQFGSLVKVDGQLLLRFGQQDFHPQNDIEQLLASSYVQIENRDDGRPHNVIYLDVNDQQNVLLAEYLSSFQMLNQAGIDITFAERVGQ